MTESEMRQLEESNLVSDERTDGKEGSEGLQHQKSARGKEGDLQRNALLATTGGGTTDARMKRDSVVAVAYVCGRVLRSEPVMEWSGRLHWKRRAG